MGAQRSPETPEISGPPKTTGPASARFAESHSQAVASGVCRASPPPRRGVCVESGVDSWHRELLAGDRRHVEELTRLLMHYARPVLYRRFPRVDRTVIDDSIENAILAYLRLPHRFQDHRAQLTTFISVIATSKVLTRLQREKRRVARMSRVAAELAARARCEQVSSSNGPREDRGNSRAPSNGVVGSGTGLAFVVRVVTPERWLRRFLCARLRGERAREQLASFIGVKELAADIQRNRLKRAADLIRVRVKRISQRLEAGSVMAVRRKGRTP